MVCCLRNSIFDVCLFDSVDATMKVAVEVLARVYEALQDQGQHTEIEKDIIDPDSHLFVIDAFEIPRWQWSQERGTFERCVGFHGCCQYFTDFLQRVSSPLTSSGSAESRVHSVRDKLNIIKQCVLRNEHFAPSTLPSRDRERLVTVC